MLFTQVKPLLKKHGFEIAFRGQNKRNPPAPGQLSDFYPIENINADRKRALRDAVNASKRWRDGVGHLRLGHGKGGRTQERKSIRTNLTERTGANRSLRGFPPKYSKHLKLRFAPES